MSDNFRRHPATAKTPEAYASAIIIKIFENLDKVQFTKAEKLTSQNPSSARLLLPLAPVMDLNFQGRIDVIPFPIWSPVQLSLLTDSHGVLHGVRVEVKARRVPYLSTKTCTSRARLLGSWIKAIHRVGPVG